MKSLEDSCLSRSINFYSKEHKAKIRGFVIGEELLAEAAKAGVDVELNFTVIGMYQDKEIVVKKGRRNFPL